MIMYILVMEELYKCKIRIKATKKNFSSQKHLFYYLESTVYISYQF
jgi:hypothetical protein